MTIVSEQYLDIVTYNKNALNNLRRAVVLGQGQFSLILARVNYQRLQRVLMVELGVNLHLDKVEISPDATSLRSVMEAAEAFSQAAKSASESATESASKSAVDPFAEPPAELPAELPAEPPVELPNGPSVSSSAEQPRALMLTGLERVSAAEIDGLPSQLEKLLKAANLSRDELPKRFSYPVILWVNDVVLQQLNRYAPDLKSFAATPIRFEYPAAALIERLRSQAADTFTQILDVNKGIVLNNCLPLSASITEPLAARELNFAISQLEHLPAAQSDLVTNSLLADLLFLQGRSLHQQGELIRARGYYEKSLVHWQLEAADIPAGATKEGTLRKAHVLQSRDKQAVLKFHLGLWWRSQATQEKDSTPAYQQARAYFEGCLTIFRQQNRSDRIARFVLALADVLQKLEDWPALEQVAKESIRLHHHDLARLARDYSYLAEVALARYQEDAQSEYLSQAQGFAQQALETSDRVLQSYAQDVDGITSASSKIALRYHRGCYFYLLAIAYQLQHQSLTAIEHLERALQNIDPHYDLSLYRRILARLWQLYFDHKHYAEAFEVKLEQRRIETLFGLRAFIGASQIQPFTPRLPYSSSNAAVQSARGSVVSTASVISTAIEASGRTEDIESLVSRLSQPRYTLVVMHGQSGVGKSSILRAGLVPRLRRLISEGRTALPVLVSSYSDWIKQVYSAINSQSEGLLDPAIDLAVDPAVELVPDSQSADSNQLSATLLLDTLQQLTNQKYQQVILIFDQFEDFFYQHPTFVHRRGLYSFLRDCLDLPYVKIVLSLREDFLHYLLEWDRNANLSIINNDILSKDIRYYLGNFTPKAAEALINQLTQLAGFELEPALVTALVDELAAETGEVRPIELQVVGAQLQREEITTLSAYRLLGRSPKSQLLKNFLNSVVRDCGPENNLVARSILYLLSEGENRPLKSLSELQEPLLLANIESAPQQLSLVLDILIGSGLVFEVPEVSGVRYQLVHEYLASLVQDQQQPGLIEVLQAERNRRQLAEDQLQKALAAQSDTLMQATLARHQANVSEIKATISVARSLYLSGDGIDALAKGLRAARQVSSVDDAFLKLQVALCLATSLRDIHERNELVGHRNWVLAVDCRPQLDAPERIVSASEDDTLKLWNGKGELVRSLTGHQASVIDVCFSPDGEYLASASLDHTIRLWRANGDFIRQIAFESASVTSLSFSPSEPLLAATYSDTTVRLWDLAGQRVRSLEGHEDWVRAVAFSPDGQRLVTGGEDNTVRLWSVGGELLDTLHGHRGWVRSVDFSPDGQLIVSAGDANEIRVWSVDGYKLITFYGHEDWVRAVAFSPNGRLVASASDDQTIRIWTLDGTAIHTFNHRSSVHSVAWSADGNSVVSGGDDDQVHIWRLQGPTVPICQGHEGIVWSARWRPAVREIALESSSSEMPLDHSPDHPPDNSLEAQTAILSAGGDGAIKLWSESGLLLRSVEGHRRGVHCADWRPDGEFFASASADYSVKIWRADGALVKTLAGHGDAVWQVRYSPTGETLASVSSDRTVRLWSHEGELLKTWSDHTDTVWHISFSPDGEYLVSASEDNTLRLWHCEQDLMQTIDGPAGGQSGSIWCAAFDPYGRLVAAGGADGAIRLWTVIDPPTEPMRLAPDPILLRGHRDWVRSVCFSPNGQFLASSSDDGTVRLWSVSADILNDVDQDDGGMAQLLPPLLSHEGVVWDVAFDPSGERLISAGADGTARVWDLRLDALMAQGCEWLQDWLIARPEMRSQLCGDFSED